MQWGGRLQCAIRGLRFAVGDDCDVASGLLENSNKTANDWLRERKGGGLHLGQNMVLQVEGQWLGVRQPCAQPDGRWDPDNAPSSRYGAFRCDVLSIPFRDRLRGFRANGCLLYTSRCV